MRRIVLVLALLPALPFVWHSTIGRCGFGTAALGSRMFQRCQSFLLNGVWCWNLRCWIWRYVDKLWRTPSEASVPVSVNPLRGERYRL